MSTSGESFFAAGRRSLMYHKAPGRVARMRATISTTAVAAHFD
jgi:hypothetical protein